MCLAVQFVLVQSNTFREKVICVSNWLEGSIYDCGVHFADGILPRATYQFE
jgi:hypothetical protein